MLKRLLFLCVILFLNVNLTGELKEKASLEELRQKGLPVKSMENAGISKEDMEKYHSPHEIVPLHSAFFHASCFHKKKSPSLR